MVKAVIANRDDLVKFTKSWAQKDLDSILALYADAVKTRPDFMKFFDILKEIVPFVEVESQLRESAFEGQIGFALFSTKATCVKEGMTMPWVLARPQDIKIMTNGDVVQYEEIVYFKCDPETGLIADVKAGTTRA